MILKLSELGYLRAGKRFVGGGDANKKNRSFDNMVLSIADLNRTRKRFVIDPDGSCLYRCLAKHQYGDQDEHVRVRRELANELASNPDDWINNKLVYLPGATSELTGDANKSGFDDYINHIRTPFSEGDIGCFYVAEKIYHPFTFKIFEYSDNKKGSLKLSKCSEALNAEVKKTGPWARPRLIPTLNIHYSPNHYDYISPTIRKDDFVYQDTIMDAQATDIISWINGVFLFLY